MANQPSRRPLNARIDLTQDDTALTQDDTALTQGEHRRRADDVPLSAPALVMFRDGMAGKGYRQFETIEAALDFVENLRNDANMGDLRVFRLEEVEFAFIKT